MTIVLPGTGMSYRHLEKPRQRQQVEPPGHAEPEVPDPDATRGLVWIALIVVMIVWWAMSNPR